MHIIEAQGEGTAGNASVAHLKVLKEAIQKIRKKGKTAYVAYLDVQKVYDKSCLYVISYVMHKNGISVKNLEMMRKMNSDLTARDQIYEPIYRAQVVNPQHQTLLGQSVAKL